MSKIIKDEVTRSDENNRHGDELRTTINNT